MDGRSLLPLLQGERPEGWRGHTFSELDFSEPLRPSLWQQALGTGVSESNLSILRTDRYTLVEFAADLPPMLFDAEVAGGMENVADRAENQELLTQMTRQLLRHRMGNMDHTLSTYTITPQGALAVQRER